LRDEFLLHHKAAGFAVNRWVRDEQLLLWAALRSLGTACLIIAEFRNFIMEKKLSNASSGTRILIYGGQLQCIAFVFRVLLESLFLKGCHGSVVPIANRYEAVRSGAITE